MNVSEFLALSEQYVAFETIMKDKLHIETENCKQILEDLRNGRIIIELAEFNERESKRLNEFRQAMDEQFKKEQIEIEENKNFLEQKEKTLTTLAEELSTRERTQLKRETNKQRDLDLAVEEYQRNMIKLREIQRLNTEKEKELLEKEKYLDQKMAAIKAFA